jgi:hypothetical protein
MPFFEEAAMHPHPSPDAFEGVPSFFRACCLDVKCGRVPAGYEHPARELVRHLADLVPHQVDAEEWSPCLRRLALLVADRDDQGVLDWFLRHYPRCLALIPKRRRPNFLAGVYAAAEEFGIEEEWSRLLRTARERMRAFAPGSSATPPLSGADPLM